MNPKTPAIDNSRARAMSTLRVDRHALKTIAANEAIIAALVETHFSINGIYNTDLLLERLLERIFGLVPDADSGVVFFAGRQPDQLDPVAFRGSPPAVHSAIAALAHRDRVAILSQDGDSILCVPMRVFDMNYGVIYLHSPEPEAFTMEELHLLIAIACISAIALGHARYVEHLESENKRLHRALEELDIAESIIGDSRLIREIRALAEKIARSDATTLIRGESGTGKELVAHAIHSSSDRAGKPYIAVNCAAIPETLIESELFGHEKGAFTGATVQKKGQVEVADGGTLFLDEIGDLPLQAQAAMLRFLENKTFQRVGGTRTLSVDVRVVAATNRNIEERIRQGLFRQDLYFRLQVIELHMPSLAARREDIPLLAAHFLKQFRRARVVTGFSSEARRILTAYDWPGNIRELRNAIERALVLGASEMIQPEDLPETIREMTSVDDPSDTSLDSQVNAFKRGVIEATIRKTQGNLPEAARLLDISHSYLHRMIPRLGVELP